MATMNPLADPGRRVGRGFLQMQRRIRQLENQVRSMLPNTMLNSCLQFPWLEDNSDDEGDENFSSQRGLNGQGIDETTQTEKILQAFDNRTLPLCRLVWC